MPISVSMNSSNFLYVAIMSLGTTTLRFIWQHSKSHAPPDPYSSPFSLPESITAEPSIGELRFIARLRRAAVPNGYVSADVNGGSAIEGSDVFNINSQTRSKFYSSRQFIDDQIHGVTGNGVGVWMIIPATGYESSSGGPFFRDINNQGSEYRFCVELSTT